MTSATLRESIHFKVSSPLFGRPTLMRSMTLAAFSSPSALVMTLRRNSSTPTPTEVWRPTPSENEDSTPLTSSRDTFCSCAIAAPIFCTSRAPMCLSTCAASCSPSVSSRIAARSVPLRSSLPPAGASLIDRHPVADHLRDALRVLVHQRAGIGDLLIIGNGRSGWRRMDGTAAGLTAVAVMMRYATAQRRGAACAADRDRITRTCEQATALGRGHQGLDHRTQHRERHHQQHDHTGG